MFCAVSTPVTDPSSHSHTANLTRFAARSAWRPFPNQCLPVNSRVATGSRGQEHRTLLDPKTPVHGPACPRTPSLSSHPHCDSMETFTWNFTFRVYFSGPVDNSPLPSGEHVKPLRYTWAWAVVWVNTPRIRLAQVPHLCEQHLHPTPRPCPAGRQHLGPLPPALRPPPARVSAQP